MNKYSIYLLIGHREQTETKQKSVQRHKLFMHVKVLYYNANGKNVKKMVKAMNFFFSERMCFNYILSIYCIHIYIVIV